MHCGNCKHYNKIKGSNYSFCNWFGEKREKECPVYTPRNEKEEVKDKK